MKSRQMKASLNSCLVSEDSLESEFRNWCSNYGLKEFTIKVLKDNDCDILFTLKCLQDAEKQSLLAVEGLSLGQRAVLRKALSDFTSLREHRPHQEESIHEVQSCPEFSYKPESTKDYVKLPPKDAETEIRRIHNRIPVELFAKIVGDDFKHIIQNAKSDEATSPAFLSNCRDIQDLWGEWEKRELIPVGNYQVPLRVFKDSKLPKLVEIIDKNLRLISYWTMVGDKRRPQCQEAHGIRDTEETSLKVVSGVQEISSGPGQFVSGMPSTTPRFSLPDARNAKFVKSLRPFQSELVSHAAPICTEFEEIQESNSALVRPNPMDSQHGWSPHGQIRSSLADFRRHLRSACERLKELEFDISHKEKA